MNTFKPNEKAMIVNTPHWEYNDTVCTVVGISSQHYDNIFYIIELSYPHENGWTHAVLTNSCLQKI